MHEPTELGSVAADNWGDLWARFHDGRWYDRLGNAKTWDKIDSPTLVHRGYIPPTPPTPEPTLPHAVVCDAEGDVMFGTREGWHLPNVGTISWSEVVQPVEIIFPGVSDV
jgi:hypothetical protein